MTNYKNKKIENASLAFYIKIRRRFHFLSFIHNLFLLPKTVNSEAELTRVGPTICVSIVSMSHSEPEELKARV